jgi:hypothetical protein
MSVPLGAIVRRSGSPSQLTWMRPATRPRDGVWIALIAARREPPVAVRSRSDPLHLCVSPCTSKCATPYRCMRIRHVHVRHFRGRLSAEVGSAGRPSGVPVRANCAHRPNNLTPSLRPSPSTLIRRSPTPKQPGLRAALLPDGHASRSVLQCVSGVSIGDRPSMTVRIAVRAMPGGECGPDARSLEAARGACYFGGRGSDAASSRNGETGVGWGFPSRNTHKPRRGGLLGIPGVRRYGMKPKRSATSWSPSPGGRSDWSRRSRRREPPHPAGVRCVHAASRSRGRQHPRSHWPHPTRGRPPSASCPAM